MIWLKPSQASRLESAARTDAPRETCGLLLGHGVEVTDVVPIANAADDPTCEFRMEERAFVRAIFDAERRGLTLLAFYHSHPSGVSAPSETDMRRAAYPDVVNVIIGLAGEPVLGAWHIRGGRAEFATLHISQSPPKVTPAGNSAFLTVALSTLLAVLILIVLSLVLLPPPPPLPAP